MSCTTSTEVAIAVYHTTGAAPTTGTVIPGSLIAPDGNNPHKTVSVINDTDQDIKITYSTVSGLNGEFIVPKSIKGFTKALKTDYFISTSFVAISLAVGTAAGNISFNFSS